MQIEVTKSMQLTIDETTKRREKASYLQYKKRNNTHGRCEADC